MPHLVQMQKDLGEKGLVVITVTTDNPDEADAAKKALAKHPTLPRNFLWQGPEGEPDKRLGVGGRPVAFLFDRDNRWVRRWRPDSKPDPQLEEYSELDKLAKPLLEKAK